MTDKKIKWVLVRFISALVIVVTLVVAVVIREGQLASEIRTGLIENCQNNGNPLREVLQKRIQHEIEQTQNRELLEKFFPNISQKELEDFIEESVEERREEQKEVAPIDCNEQYK
jgi:predicted PurR-regulated permease PerM